jgi:hypothetical protein
MHRTGPACYTRPMEKGDMKASQFADYRAIFLRALELVRRGDSVNAALSGALRELYPHTHHDIEPSLREMFESIKLSRGWGDLRALRALSEDPGLSRAPAAGEQPGPPEPPDGQLLPAYDDTVANLQEVFRTALRKTSAGFQPSDALEMACKELYPYTSRKVLRAAEGRMRGCMQENGLSSRGALKMLAGGKGP